MKALVTGGGGFLGGVIVRRLLARGNAVRSFARGEYPELTAIGVEVCRGDLADAEAVARTAEGCDVVFHAAAKAGVWGPYEAYYKTNVLGTANVIAACREHGVRRLVHTSSPSVVFDGRDQEGVDESAPYPARFLAHYPRTKARAEQMVLEANGPQLATVALRPHLIWGPGDPHLVPRLLAQGRAGKLRALGTRPNLVDSVYVDNAADAHLLAADRLRPGSPIAGKVYFISNDEPLPVVELMNRILATAGIPPITRRVPPAAAYVVGGLLEAVYYLLGLPGEPRMTRFVARQLATAHWFDVSAAKRDLGYRPAVSIEEGMERLARAIQRDSARP